MTLPSRHMIQNSSLGDLRPSTLPLGYGGSPQYWIFTSERRRNLLFLSLTNSMLHIRSFFEILGLKWSSNRPSRTFKAGNFNHCTMARNMDILFKKPFSCRKNQILNTLNSLWIIINCFGLYLLRRIQHCNFTFFPELISLVVITSQEDSIYFSI